MSMLTPAIRWPDEVAGLPLHPLVVHAVVVMLPLACLGLMVMASSGARSKRYSPAVLFVSVVAAGSAFVAEWSGKQLRLDLGIRTDSVHFEYGEYLPWAALGILALTAVVALMDRQGGGRRNAVGGIFALLSAIAAAGVIALTVLTGHAGAELVWG